MYASPAARHRARLPRTRATRSHATRASACRARGRLRRRRDACPSPRAGCENAMRNAMGLAVPDEVHARGEEVAVILLHAAVGGEPGKGSGGGQREAPARVRSSRTSRGARCRGISARGVRSPDAGGSRADRHLRVVNADLGIRDTTAVPALGVRLVLDNAVALGGTARHGDGGSLPCSCERGRGPRNLEAFVAGLALLFYARGSQSFATSR